MMFWGQTGFQDRGSLVSEYLAAFHDFTVLVLTLILVFVSFFIYYTIKGCFNHKTLFAQHSLEFIWTLLPVLVLLLIVVPSLTLLFMMEDSSESFESFKVVGSQWYWSYERGASVSENSGAEVFDSYLIPDNLSKDSLFQLLDTSSYLTVSVNIPIRLLITSSDVLHAWAVPALGAKADACPERLNEVVMVPNQGGTYYGGCSEICGSNHSFMPIELKVGAEPALLPSGGKSSCHYPETNKGCCGSLNAPKELYLFCDEEISLDQLDNFTKYGSYTKPLDSQSGAQVKLALLEGSGEEYAPLPVTIFSKFMTPAALSEVETVRSHLKKGLSNFHPQDFDGRYKFLQDYQEIYLMSAPGGRVEASRNIFIEAYKPLIPLPEKAMSLSPLSGAEESLILTQKSKEVPPLSQESLSVSSQTDFSWDKKVCSVSTQTEPINIPVSAQPRPLFSKSL